MYGKLLLELPSGDEREFVLEKETVTLGRDTDNDIVLPSPTVSRHHARLSFSPDPILEDLGSTFGTTVGGQKVTSQALHSGDELALAGIRLRFEQPRSDDVLSHTVVDLNVNATLMEQTAHDATLTHSLLDMSSDMANEASRQDATLQVVVAAQSPHLVVRENNVSRDVSLDATTVVIGRAPTCQVVLASRKASRRHAEIRREGDAYVLVDLGSANGTQVDGKAVREPRRLVDGDVIVVGDALIIFRSPVRVPRPRQTHAQTRRPAVIIPGMMGSELHRGKLVLWPNYPYLLSHPQALAPDSGPVEVIGVISEVVVVPHMIKLDAYNRLSQYLETSLGYHLGVDLLEFPYDWRQDNRMVAQQLSDAIRSWRESMGHGPVTLIAHSMGGLVCRYYLDKLDGHDHVDHFVVMGTPHLGTAKSVTTMIGGSMGGRLNIAHDAVRALALSTASSYDILPRYPCVFTERGEQVDIFSDPSWLAKEFRPFLDGARAFTAAFQPQATVPTLCIIGYGRPTMSRVIVERGERGWKLLRYEEEPIGDGGVVEQSAILDGADIHPVRQAHGALFTDPDVQRRLRYELVERR